MRPAISNNQKINIIFDISSMLYRTFYVHKSDRDITIAGLAQHSALVTLNKYFKMFRPHKVIMAFDRTSWRKEYTASDECLSKKPYKGNRRKKMTPKEKEKYELFLEHLNDFEEMMRKYTSVVCISGEGLEADDIIAGFAELESLKDENEQIIIVSSDQDLIQLLRYDFVRLIDPASGKDRSLDDWGGDPDYFMFEKCIRGDIGDNVQSAYPRVRKTRIKKAYEDTLERVNMMHETWSIGDTTYTVKDMFKENQLLMDLRCQPEHIQQRIVRSILTATRDPGKFDYFQFMRFLGKYELKAISKQVETFVPMLSR